MAKPPIIEPFDAAQDEVVEDTNGEALTEAFDPSQDVVVAQDENLDEVLLEDRGQVVTASSSMTGPEIQFAAETQLDEKPKRQFFGMVDFGLGAMKGAALFFTSPDWGTRNLEKYAHELEKEQPNVLTGFTEFLRGKSNSEFAVELQAEADKLIVENDAFVKKYGLDPKGQAEETGAMIGSGFASVLASIGTAVLTKDVFTPAAIFTDIQNAAMFREGRNKGWDVDKAAMVANIDSVPQFVLEFWGLHTVMELAVLSKPIKNKLLKAVAIGSVEALQEGGQQTAEETTAALSGLREDSLTDKVIRIGQAAAVGLITGASASAVLDVVQKRGIVKELVKEGVPKEKAVGFAEKVIDAQMESPEVRQEIMDTIAREMSPEAQDPEVVKLRDKLTQEALAPAGEEKPAAKPAEMKFSPEEVLVMEGRVEQLETETDQILDQIDTLEAEKKALKEKGLSTKSVDAKLDGLAQKFDVADSEIADLQTSLEPEVRARDKILTTAEKVFKMAAQKVKEGVKLTREEIANVQGEAINFIKATPMEAKDRAKFLSTVKNVQTEEGLVQALFDVEERASKFREATRKKKAIARIKTGLKKSSPKMRTGKPIGKYTADIQAIMDKARKAVSMPRIEADLKIAENMATVADDGLLAPDLALENRILDKFSGLEDRSADELEASLGELQALAKEGRDSVMLKQKAKSMRAEAMVKDAIATIQGTSPVKASDKPTKGAIATIKKAMSTLGKSLSGWDDLMNAFSQYDKTSKSFESKLSKAMSTIDVELKEKADAQAWGQKFARRAMAALGLKKEGQLFKQLERNKEEVDLGVFKDADNQEVRLILSKEQAISMWMQMQDKSLHGTIFSGEGGYRIDDREVRGLSKEMRAAVEDFLSAEDVALAKVYLDFYADYYDHINEKYRVDYGVDLPFNENYSPIRRETSKKEVTYSFLDEQNFRKSLLPGSLQSRVRTREKIRLEGASDVLLRHITEMEHYVNWSEKLRDIQSVFGDSRVQNLIRQRFGKGSLSMVNEFVVDFVRGGGEKGRAYDKIVNKLVGNFTTSVLAMKPNFILKQFTSFVAYADSIPTAEFVKGLADFASDPVRAYQILSTSNLMKTRTSNIDRDIKNALESREFNLFRRSPTFKNAMLFFVKAGDKASILVGGWPVYKYTLEQTHDHQKAIAAFDKATTQTQQSSLLSQLSTWQRGNSLARLFTLFTSAQNQYLRQEIVAVRDGLNGRLTPAQVAKKLLIYHAILPAFFQYVANFGRWDKDEEARAMILGSLNGVFLLNDILDSVLRTYMKSAWEADLETYDSTLPIFIWKRGIEKAIRDFEDGDLELSDMVEAIAELGATTAGPLTGTPVRQILNTYEGVTDISEGEVGRGLLKLAGWSPHTVNKMLDKD